ncbi:response regulator [Aphanothece hegewaldii CCALA 016]|uniref:Protein PatA n=1 Tax=Aphanothece hegewaldii CCALA 016 TaxID=2107694 RepID=A0A2T1M032_9CHRO|nr:response regulator [Aphanothece hegewaldii]PSF37945.1 response regulator [Aphanothece hegewaldii CCALA 016]
MNMWNDSANSTYDLLLQLAQNEFSGCLEISHQSVYWWIYFELGKLFYATNSLEPFERLERYLKRLSHSNTQINGFTCSQVRVKFESNHQTNNSLTSSDYEAIKWLLQQEYIKQEEAVFLINKVMEEVLEACLLLPNFNLNILPNNIWHEVTFIVQNEVYSFLKKILQNLAEWQTLAPQIFSSYQRPYFFSQYNSQNNQLSSEKQQQLSRFLKGFSFRQLAAILDQDVLRIAQGLHPLITNGVVILREPRPPFSDLPSLATSQTQLNNSSIVKRETIQQNNNIFLDNKPLKIVQNSGTIICIDDSPIMLKQLNHFLADHNFSVHTVNDPLKALMEVIRIKPNLILMDVSMPNLDGYQLCRLLRNHSLFKTTPIIMVTGNKGLIDRAKAKIAGATDYLTKPFNQTELLKIIFRYLT